MWGIPPFFVTGAIDLFGHRPDLIEWIPNKVGDATQFPRPGDMVIWGPSTKVGTGTLGHVDIFVSGNGLSFVGFDENWPLNAKPHSQAHTYDGVKGWGRRRTFSLAGLTGAQLDQIIGSQSWDQIMASYGQAGFQALYARAHPPAPAPIPPPVPPVPVPPPSPPPPSPVPLPFPVPSPPDPNPPAPPGGWAGFITWLRSLLRWLLPASSDSSKGGT